MRLLLLAFLVQSCGSNHCPIGLGPHEVPGGTRTIDHSTGSLTIAGVGSFPLDDVGIRDGTIVVIRDKKWIASVVIGETTATLFRCELSSEKFSGNAKDGWFCTGDTLHEATAETFDGNVVRAKVPPESWDGAPPEITSVDETRIEGTSKAGSHVVLVEHAWLETYPGHTDCY